VGQSDIYRFGGENVKERVYLEDPGVESKIILKWILKMQGETVWTGLNWLRTGTSGRLL
jgi:hypothetical protein